MELKQRLEQVKERIRRAAEACGRDAGSVRLVAVSKTVAPEAVREALEAGVAPPVVLEATHVNALDIVSIEDLKKHALDLDVLN